MKKKRYRFRVGADGFDTGDSSEVRPGEIYSYKQINSLLDELERESDRSAVLVATSILDEICGELLKRIFKNGNSRSRAALFEANGAFATFSARIEALFCLGYIDKSYRDDLHILRRLRNHCAHNWQSFKFTNEIEVDFIDKLQNIFPSPVPTPNESGRSRLARMCLFHLLFLNLRRELTAEGNEFEPTSSNLPKA